MGCAKTKELTEDNFQGGLIGGRCQESHKRSCLEDDKGVTFFEEAMKLQTVAKGNSQKPSREHG